MDSQVTLDNGIQLLPSVDDVYGGVIVEMSNPMEITVFHTMLKASMTRWSREGKKGVWLKLPIELANLVETAVKEGFWYHHAEKNYLMLVHWIPKTVATLPPNASHRVGVGAIVINDKREMLVVQEAAGILRRSGIWKIPTGTVEEGESICRAAVREVKEETGVDAEFVELLAFRESHKSYFQKSDFFFMCFLRPISFEIQIQEIEIEAAQWIPIEEYAAQPIAQGPGIFKFVVDICLAKLEKSYTGFCPTAVSSAFGSDENVLYLNTRDMSEADSSNLP